MTAAIQLQGLVKQYGSSTALAGVDLEVPEGSVFGFLGPNGAGKTTTLRILNGLARPSTGKAEVFGFEAGSTAARAITGYLPDVPGFYDWMNAEEFLRFTGGLFGLSGTVLDERISVLLDLAGLAGVATRIGGYSRGMKQRLGVAQALVNAPRVLMLDEPTSALDPLGRRDVLEMIASLRGRTTVFFSTHILADVERVCDTVAVLDRGRVLAHAPIDELKNRYGAQRLIVQTDVNADVLMQAVADESWFVSAEPAAEGSLNISVSDSDAAGRRIPSIIADRGWSLRRLENAEIDLEEVFMELVGAGSER